MTHPLIAKLPQAQIDYMVAYHELNVTMEDFTRRVGMPNDADTLAMRIAAINSGHASMQLQKLNKAIALHELYNV